jgi:hypothetical protein
VYTKASMVKVILEKGCIIYEGVGSSWPKVGIARKETGVL